MGLLENTLWTNSTTKKPWILIGLSEGDHIIIILKLCYRLMKISNFSVKKNKFSSREKSCNCKIQVLNESTLVLHLKWQCKYELLIFSSSMPIS